ncbi:LAFE_0D08856g1_1 [Lachancea fermentati]|uniref:LAFE_0D08856g1_1 n=1 Tax=Lachancea fermentati TaxID=4955 RepID=A0A1G4MBX6_LACFM|nr:LAFE_0D08856g1_1 [Lachancea fermentati]
MNNVKRPDLSVAYNHVKVPSPYTAGVSQGILSQSMPMAAMFMKNKFLAWFAVISMLHYYLTGEVNESASADQSPLLKIVMSLVSLLVCYMGLALPQPPAIPRAPPKSGSE